MRRLLQATTIGFFLLTLLPAQQSDAADTFLENYKRELAFREIESRRSNVDREIALRRHARYLEAQFIARMNRFAALWTALIRDYNEKKVFNMKMASEVTKAFHEIEDNDGWLKPASKAKR